MNTTELYYYTGVDLRNNELVHFGIKGMKWGHRKARPRGTAKSRLSKKSVNLNDAKSIRKNWKHMTPEQKTKALTTLSLESKYDEYITKHNNSVASYGNLLKAGGAAIGTASAMIGLYGNARKLDDAYDIFNRRKKNEKQ